MEAKKVLPKILIGNAITVLALDSIWLITHLLQTQQMFSSSTSQAIALLLFDFGFFGAFVLGVIGFIFSLIIFPLCKKDSKLLWLLGFVLNLIGLLIPGVIVGFIGFFIFCLVNPFAFCG